jgi:anti-sigma B factor antagonist
MKLQHEYLSDALLKVSLAGRMDIAGTAEIDNQLAAVLTVRNATVIVDMADVSYIASIGIRSLILNARAVARRGQKLVLAAATPAVAEVLSVSGLEQLIPFFPDVPSAQRALA